MKVRIRGVAGLCEAWLEFHSDCSAEMVVRHPNGDDVAVSAPAAFQKVTVVWATPGELEVLQKQGFVK